MHLLPRLQVRRINLNINLMHEDLRPVASVQKLLLLPARDYGMSVQYLQGT